jgi:hypothetical protein
MIRDIAIPCPSRICAKTFSVKNIAGNETVHLKVLTSYLWVNAYFLHVQCFFTISHRFLWLLVGVFYITVLVGHIQILWKINRNIIIYKNIQKHKQNTSLWNTDQHNAKHCNRNKTRKTSMAITAQLPQGYTEHIKAIQKNTHLLKQCSKIWTAVVTQKIFWKK